MTETDNGSDICPDCGLHYELGDWPFNCRNLGHAPGPFYTGSAALHTSEKVTIYENPRTGITHIPGRVDRPMHPKLVADGFIPRTLDHATDIRQLEKSKGLIHESSNYDNSGTAERDTGSI